MVNPSAGGVWATVTAGGVSDPFTLPTNANALALASVVQAIGSGTFQCFADVQDDGGNWVQVAACTAQTTASTQTATALSLANALPAGPTDVARLRWTATVAASVILVAVGR